MYEQVIDSGDVVIQEQGFSIVDKHEPAIAISLSLFFLLFVDILDTSSYRNRLFLIGRRQEVRRFVSSESGDDSLPSGNLYNGDLFGSISKGG